MAACACWIMVSSGSSTIYRGHVIVCCGVFDVVSREQFRKTQPVSAHRLIVFQFSEGLLCLPVFRWLSVSP